MSLPTRAPAAVLVVAALAPALAMLRPPEIVPAGRLVLALVAAAALALVGLRPRAAAPLPAWTVLLLPPAAAAVLAAPNRARAIDEAALFAALLALALLGREAARDPSAPATIATSLALLGSAAAALAAAQALWLYPHGAAALRAAGAPVDAFSDAVLVRLEAGRPSGPFILPAALAGFIALTLPATLAGLGRGRTRPVRVAAGAGAALQVAALLLTRSLGGLVAAAVAAALLVAPRAARRVAAAAAVAVVATVVAAGFLYDRRAEIGAGPGRDPLSLRAGNWGAAAAMARDHPLVGAGPGGFATAYTAYIRDGMNETRFAHNSWLQILACWGLWAALPLLAGAAALARAAAASRSAAPERAALAAGGAAFALHNLVDFTLFLPGVAVAGAIAIGTALGETGDREGEDGRRDRPTARRLRVAAALLLAGALAMHGYVGMRAGGLLEEARRRAEADDHAGALAAAGGAAAARPGDPDPRALVAEMILAHHMEDASLARQGVAAATAAVQLDPRSAVRHATRAAYHAAAGENAAARVELERARALYPAKPAYQPPGDGG